MCIMCFMHYLPSRRLTPKNVHQRPTVALLCGPHVQGSQGISCGRHLANHEVEVILFLPNFVKMLDSVTQELALYSKTGGKQVSSIKGTNHWLVHTSQAGMLGTISDSVSQSRLTCILSLSPQTSQTPPWT